MDDKNICRKYKTISTGEFIIVLLFIFLSVVIGMYVKHAYF